MNAKSWNELKTVARDMPFVVDRIRLSESGIVIEGPFELPPLARLSEEDQAFVTAFVRSHGSIKQMEKYFGVSYPTIKNRLNAIGSRLEFVDIAPRSTRLEILDQLEKGEITADQAVELLQKGN
jgi:hypothetical protein